MMLNIVKFVPKYRLTVEFAVIRFQRSTNRSYFCGIHLFYFRVVDISYRNRQRRHILKASIAFSGAPVVGERKTTRTFLFLYKNYLTLNQYPGKSKADAVLPGQTKYKD